MSNIRGNMYRGINIPWLPPSYDIRLRYWVQRATFYFYSHLALAPFFSPGYPMHSPECYWINCFWMTLFPFYDNRNLQRNFQPHFPKDFKKSCLPISHISSLRSSFWALRLSCLHFQIEFFGFCNKVSWKNRVFGFSGQLQTLQNHWSVSSCHPPWVPKENHVHFFMTIFLPFSDKWDAPNILFWVNTATYIMQVIRRVFSSWRCCQDRW